ncbi:hypothetical protein DFJ73DRAFT_768490 [Zopfochytrium polystomum]|nr:hypothetical protein DFJ73DRAFT_768490 [Zopfochytrium polystomum]
MTGCGRANAGRTLPSMLRLVSKLWGMTFIAATATPLLHHRWWPAPDRPTRRWGARRKGVVELEEHGGKVRWVLWVGVAEDHTDWINRRGGSCARRWRSAVGWGDLLSVSGGGDERDSFVVRAVAVFFLALHRPMTMTQSPRASASSIDAGTKKVPDGGCGGHVHSGGGSSRSRMAEALTSAHAMKEFQIEQSAWQAQTTSRLSNLTEAGLLQVRRAVVTIGGKHSQ